MKHTRRFVVAGLTASVAIGATGALAAAQDAPKIEMQVDDGVVDELSSDDAVAADDGDSPVSEVSQATVDEASASEPSVEEQDEVAATDLVAEGDDAVAVQDDTVSPPSEPSEESVPSEPSPESEESVPSEPSPESEESVPSEPSPESEPSVEDDEA